MNKPDLIKKSGLLKGQLIFCKCETKIFPFQCPKYIFLVHVFRKNYYPSYSKHSFFFQVYFLVTGNHNLASAQEKSQCDTQMCASCFMEAGQLFFFFFSFSFLTKSECKPAHKCHWGKLD